MTIARLYRVLAVVIWGSLGTGLLIHANHIHYHDQAWAFSFGTISVWLALAVAVTR